MIPNLTVAHIFQKGLVQPPTEDRTQLRSPGWNGPAKFAKDRREKKQQIWGSLSPPFGWVSLPFGWWKKPYSMNTEIFLFKILNEVRSTGFLMTSSDLCYWITDFRLKLDGEILVSFQHWLSQWPTFKLLGIGYSTGKIKFELIFHGSLAEYEHDPNLEKSVIVGR